MLPTEPAALPAFETKALDAPTAQQRDAHDTVMNAWSHFVDTNDTAERAGDQDPLTRDKLERISGTIDEHLPRASRGEAKARRPMLEGALRTKSEHRTAFETYVRRGETGDLARFEVKALSAGSATDGGYTAPPEVEAEIGRKLSVVSPIRSIASVRMVSSSVYRKPFATTGMPAGWVGETATRAQTATPALEALDFPAMELYAMPAATQAILDDSVVDLAQWIASEVEITFAEQEGAAFVAGDGNAKPKGFMAVDQVAEASWIWGKLGFVTSGAAGAFAGSSPSDKFIELIYTLKAGYRQNATFVMNRKTQAEVRKFKGADGHYLWLPPVGAGARATLMNYPLVEAEEMPDIAANTVPIAFGDFRRGYLIVDRMGVRVLRDPYSAKPYVLFYTTKRVGGGVQDFNAIKLMKMAT